MRKLGRTLARTVATAAAAAAFAAVFVGAALHAGDEDAENKKVEDEALAKAVTRGSELFHSKDLGKKSCATCHENPDKPEFNLATRQFGYPKYSRKAKAVVSMGQKINEMLTTKSGAAKEMDAKSPDLVAIEAYVVSLKSKK